MSHELRTPLNAIVGFSEVMKAELFGAHSVDSYKEYSSDIHASGQHLLMLINEILDLSRIESGHFELKEEEIKYVAKMVLEGRFPSKVRCGTRQSVVFSAFTSSAVLPNARASDCASKFAVKRS